MLVMKFADELRALSLPSGTYAITGSGPLAIRNLIRLGDLDVIVTEALWKKLSLQYPVAENGCHLRIGNIDIWKNCPYIETKTEEMIRTAETIDGLPFVRLSYTLEWKRKMRRPKDMEDIAIIEKYFKEEGNDILRA